MIYITGDTHADFSRFSNWRCPVQAGDMVIICGDFGGVWNDSAMQRYWLDWLADKPYTIAFADGNHENFDMLNAYPVDEWNGGKVHFVRPNVIHLMRGQIYNIEGKTFFVMGGAKSHDISDGILDPADPRFKTKRAALKKRNAYFRVKGVSWWAEELPSADEYAEAERNLTAAGNKVDYIITHSAPSMVEDVIGRGTYAHDKLTDWLEKVRETVEFKGWFFGHYHGETIVEDRMVLLYHSIMPLDAFEQFRATQAETAEQGTDSAEPDTPNE